MSHRHLVILGLMGVGKSTTASAVAAATCRAHRDSDRDIEARTGVTGRCIAERDGVDALHALEEAVLLDALASDAPAVISAAGWTIESEQCRAAMAERADVVLLDAPDEVILSRMATGGHRRSMSPAELAEVRRRRAGPMAAAADLVADSTRPTPELAAEIATWWRSRGDLAQ